MILLDENIAEDQGQLLKSWRIRFRQIGQDIGRQGMKDEEDILPLLHQLNRPTFLTRDLGFFDESRRHAKYALVCLAVSQKETALFIRRFLQHPSFNTKAKRLASVVIVSRTDLRFWRLHGNEEERTDWPD